MRNPNMRRARQVRWSTVGLVVLLGSAAGGYAVPRASGQEMAPAPTPLQAPAALSPVPTTLPAPAGCDRPLPINLATALHLANVRALDVAIASERVRLAAAQLERANVLWL